MKLLLPIALLALSPVEGAPALQDAPKKPNIVVILADDLGWSDIGCYGGEIETPALDRMAAGGLRFTQFYNGARCCPTRASLLTGLYPHQAGVGHMVEGKPAPGYQGFLNDRCVTIAEALRPAGYRTLMSGKWHVGEKKGHWPSDRGFDRVFSLVSGASNYFRLETGRKMEFDGAPWTPPADKPFFITDAFADRALDFVDEAVGMKKPFFLYLAFTSPHWPLHAPPDDIAKYRGKYRDGWDAVRARRLKKQVELGLLAPDVALTPRDPKAPSWDEVKNADERDLRMAVYAAQVDRMDRQIGRLLERLKALGVEDDTLVMFLADNGGCAEEIHRGRKDAEIGSADSYESYGLPWANASNTPFRSYKHWVHEGGIATPFIARWPASIRKTGITHEPGHLVDVMATCLEVGGAAYPADKTPVEGKSLVPVFRDGRREGHASLFWEHEGNRAVRQGRWKLVARHRQAWELYDLEADRTELNDLASTQTERVAAMSASWDAWAARAGVVPWEELNRRK